MTEDTKNVIYKFSLYWGRRLTKGSHEVDDIASETCLRLWKNSRNYNHLVRGNLGFKKNPELKAGVFYIVRGTVRDFLRQKSRLCLYSDLSDSEESFEDRVKEIPDTNTVPTSITVMQNETLTALENALANLPQTWKDVLCKRYWEGLGYRETADHLNISGRAAKQRAYRARENLRRKLSKYM